MIFSFGVLAYAFWASGYFGGPQPIPKGREEEYTPPVTFCDRVSCVATCCCNWLSEYHDKESCFWSFILLFEGLVLVLFVVSIVFVMLGGIQIFVGATCSQIYIIGDTK